ncbi:putative short-chain dehydrogenase/reductase [Bombardia bombarda]|uniref:Short-chain dehydrogenase/reductase n=1 Tax=Bombardia bombarda TaxID=252184 RepID=A0AA40C5Y6_9PEZI|nr:putative short-chain dehydrogenase/reductase [Bombardia bombarda]
MLSKKTVLITGCSQGGLGEALARAFLAKDFYVFATLRNVAKAGPLATLENVEILPLEATSVESIQAAAQAVAKRTGGSLDVLVNNAGADFVMPLLDVPIDEAKKLFDLNVWSILATTQAFTPMLVKAKGSICNIISTAACMSFAYAGIYSSSKVAARRISETLRIELAPLGVRVITCMAGAIHTPIHTNAGELRLPEGSYYTVVRDTISKQREGAMKPGAQTPDVTAKSIVNDIVAGKSGEIWRGGLSSLVRYLAALVPGVLEYIINGDKDLPLVKKEHSH